MISNELLEALLSPDTSHRQNAEAHFASMLVHARIEGLIRLLETTKQQSTTHLAAVLLRRDILQLTASNELKALVPSLLSLIAVRGIHDCLAQVCSSLQLLDLQVGVETVTTILKVRLCQVAH